MSFTTIFQQKLSRIPLAESSMRRLGLYGLCCLTGCLVISTMAIAHEGPNVKGRESLSGERVISGTVEEIRGEQAKVSTEEGQPRYLPMNLREEKGLPALKKGDRVEITVNDQNLIVDVHPAGEESHHRIVQGVLAHPLVTGHDKAVSRKRDRRNHIRSVRWPEAKWPLSRLAPKPHSSLMKWTRLWT